MNHHTLDLLRGAVVHHGYWAVAVLLLLESAGLPLPGETVLLLASFLAYTEHELRFPGSLWSGQSPRHWAESWVLLWGGTAGVR